MTFLKTEQKIWHSEFLKWVLISSTKSNPQSGPLPCLGETKILNSRMSSLYSLNSLYRTGGNSEFKNVYCMCEEPLPCLSEEKKLLNSRKSTVMCEARIHSACASVLF
jgi:hypothetical protein